MPTDLSAICRDLEELGREAAERDDPTAIPIGAAREFNRLVAEAARLAGEDARLAPLPAEDPDHPRAPEMADREFAVVIADARRALGCGTGGPSGDG